MSSTGKVHGGVLPIKVPPGGGDGGGDEPVTSEQDGGGPILTQAKLSLIYWGNFWTNPITTPTSNQFTSALTGIINGPWGTQLNQYHGIGRPKIDQTITFTSSNPPSLFVENDIEQFVDSRISSNDVIAPSTSTQRIYVVLLPVGSTPTDNPSIIGRHQNYFRPGGVPVYYSWVINDGTLTSINSLPKVFSHEISEALTDPNVSTGPLGITLNNEGGSGEIGDVCNTTFKEVDGYAVEAYWSSSDKRCVLPVHTPYPQFAADPALIQSRFGKKGNFELVVADAHAGLVHIWRNNDNPFLPWSRPTTFGTTVGSVSGVSLIESNYDTPGNFEVAAIAGGRLLHFWHGPNGAWNGPIQISPNLAVSGIPSLIQGKFGHKGNFELVAPAAAGGLVHLSRNNDSGNGWSPPTHFGQSLGNVTGVTVIQSNFGSPGNLEVVAIANNKLHTFWRNSGPAFRWYGPSTIEASFQVTGNPALIQSRYGTKGNFELVAPSASGGLLHFWRNNDSGSLPWSGATHFGQNSGIASGVTLIESNFGTPGNFEVIANTGGLLKHFWRGSKNIWNEESTLSATTW